jgi:ATP/maltotriose-dependent transcriptional regulator MalT
MVSSGLSNPEIAERLLIAPGTAKTHVHNILEKLNAKDRLHAVIRAKDLHLI